MPRGVYDRTKSKPREKGFRHSDETKRKMSKERKGKYIGENHPFWGGHHSDDSKRKISEALKGGKKPPRSEEHRRNTSKALMGRKFSEEHRANLSKTHLKNGRYKDTKGYILIHKPDHPFCNAHRYVFEHRLVIEKYLRRFLTPKEQVHHINEITNDNRIENLMGFANFGYHMNFHLFGYCNPNGIIFDGRKL